MLATDVKVKDIPIDRIVIIDDIRNVQPDDPDTVALAQSMYENGQEIEVRVFVQDGVFVLKAGHRRYIAAKSLGWQSIRAVIEPAPANKIEFLIEQTIENEQRVPLTYLQKARIFQQLKAEGYNQQLIARTFGVSTAQVSLMTALLRADPKLQEAVDKGKLSPSAVEPLLSQPLETQVALADAAIQAKTVARVTALVQAHKRNAALSQKVTEAAPVSISVDIDPLEELAISELTEALEHLNIAFQTRLTHPTLVRRALPLAEQLAMTAQTYEDILKES